MAPEQHPLDRLIVKALEDVIDREWAEKIEVRDEIKQKGTYWAAGEIWKLRRQVAALQRKKRGTRR